MENAYAIIIAGVGGQGALTVAQLILGAARRSGHHVLQSEVHGMSQRGGAVNAQIIFDKKPVTGPIIAEGSGDLIIGLEPMEALRYLPFLRKEANLVVSTSPIKNISNYPDEDKIIKVLKSTAGIQLINTDEVSKKLNYRHAGNMVLLGSASKFMPIDFSVWKEIIAERFKSKGNKVVEQNIEAFDYGRNL